MFDQEAYAILCVIDTIAFGFAALGLVTIVDLSIALFLDWLKRRKANHG